MKKFVFTIVVLLGTLSLSAQSKVVDKLFEKYSERDGFTTVVITKHMFNLFSNVETEADDEYMNMIKNLKNIRILTGPESSEEGLNFYDAIMKELPEKEYEELMVIHDSDKDIKFLVKEENNMVSELLMVIGGKADNVLISITGNIDMKSISKLSKSMGIQGMENLDKIDENKKEK
jgi:hypothetical protein